MHDLNELRQRLQTQRPVPWDQLPDFALYMDQVLSYMDRQVIRFDEDDGLTAAMVNNYTKSGLVPRAEGKKYNRDHLAYLTAICVLKHVMSTRDMDLADAAIHFALLSYAAGVASSRYVTLLRQQKEAAQEPHTKKSKKEHD